MGQRGVGGPRSGHPKKDRQGNQGIRREIGEEIRDGSATPVLQRDRNRDTARGDWDRTGRRHDEDVSPDDEGEAADARDPERVKNEKARDDL